MGKWSSILYDMVMKSEKTSKVHKMRKSVISEAHGKVLEIGSGTGINFPLYNDVNSVNAIEPCKHMIVKSWKRKSLSSIPIKIDQQTAEDLSFLENTFDSVVNTLVFCTIPHPLIALKNIQRVAKPGATILFLEHVKMKHSFFSKIQDILSPTWKKIAGGCHLNRDTLAMIKASGLEVVEVTTFYKDLGIKVKCVNNKAESRQQSSTT